MTTTLVLEDARARYAAHPDHTPYGQCSDHCVVMVIDHALLDRGIWDKEAEVALARAAGIK